MAMTSSTVSKPISRVGEFYDASRAGASFFVKIERLDMRDVVYVNEISVVRLRGGSRVAKAVDNASVIFNFDFGAGFLPARLPAGEGGDRGGHHSNEFD